MARKTNTETVISRLRNSRGLRRLLIAGTLGVSGLVNAACSSSETAANPSTTTVTTIKPSTTSSTLANSKQELDGLQIILAPASDAETQDLGVLSNAAASAHGAAVAANCNVQTWSDGENLLLFFEASVSNTAVKDVLKAATTEGSQLKTAAEEEFKIMSGANSAEDLLGGGQEGVMAETPISPTVNVSNFSRNLSNNLLRYDYGPTVVLETGGGNHTSLEVISAGNDSAVVRSFLMGAMATEASVPPDSVAIQTFHVL